MSYAWARSIGVLLAIRVLHGLCWGCSTTAAGTIAADVIPRARLGEGMGFFGLAGTLAMAVAPALGLFIIHPSGFTALFAASAFLALVALALAAAIRYARYHTVPSKLAPGPATTTAPEAEFTEPRPGPTRPALFEPRAVQPAAVMLLCNTTYGAIVTFLALYAPQRGILNIGPFFTVYAATLALTRPLAGALSDRRGYDAAVIPGLAAVALTMFVLSRAATLPTFLAAAVFGGIGFGAVGPAMQALAVHGLPPTGGVPPTAPTTSDSTWTSAWAPSYGVPCHRPLVIQGCT
jgi:MFS family permease